MSTSFITLRRSRTCEVEPLQARCLDEELESWLHGRQLFTFWVSHITLMNVVSYLSRGRPTLVNHQKGKYKYLVEAPIMKVDIMARNFDETAGR